MINNSFKTYMKLPDPVFMHLSKQEILKAMLIVYTGYCLISYDLRKALQYINLFLFRQDCGSTLIYLLFECALFPQNQKVNCNVCIVEYYKSSLWEKKLLYQRE